MMLRRKAALGGALLGGDIKFSGDDEAVNVGLVIKGMIFEDRDRALKGIWIDYFGEIFIIVFEQVIMFILDGFTRMILHNADRYRGTYMPSPFYTKDFLDCHLPREWEIARDVELNPFKDTLVFRRMVEFLGAIPINLKINMWESEDLFKNPINWDKPPKDEDGAWHAKIRQIDPDGEEFTKTLKTHLLEDKQILSVGVFDEVFSTWMAFGGNTCDLDSFREETDEITDLHQILEEVLLTVHGDSVVGIKRRRHDPSSDGVRDLVTASRRSRLDEDLESST
ncbi:hypothetical protein Tco_0798450 [Tanacetum coccineum]